MALTQTPPTFTAVTTGSDEYSVQLNDANLEGKAWRSSRYDGSKTITTTLNKYNDSDVTFGKTAAVQKYSRNIYIGNAIIGMDDGGESSINFNFPAFSYATTTKYITVNNDNTLSETIIESKKDNFDNKRGFYRAFYEDFPLGSDCRIIINDESIRTNLKDRYNIYFNGGQLQKLIAVRQPPAIAHIVEHDTGSYEYNITQQSAKYSAVVYFYNSNEIRNFYTGSLDFIDGDSANLQLNEVASYITPFFSNYKSTSNYIGDKRLFLSFCTQSAESSSPSDGTEFEPLRTIVKDNIPVGELHKTENLAEISTTEISNIDSTGTGVASTFNIDYFPIFQLNQIYDPGDFNDDADIRPAAFNKGTLMFTKCEDATPSLLLNLPKNEHLPDGVGRKSFIIIPENIHPHIKKNLIHFLSKAGVSLEVDTVPVLDTTFEKLK